MSDRVEEIEAIRRHVEAIGEKDPAGGYWLELTCAKELGIRHKRVWIHTTLRAKFVRFEKKNGKIGYNRRGRLVGEEGQPRMVMATIGHVPIYRHRAMALAAGIMTLEQYRDTKNFVIDHVEPRKKDAVPDDSPENLRVGPPSANNANPKNKKRVSQATGKPVTLTRKSTGVSTPFPSSTAAAASLGVNQGNLSNYLNGSKKQRSMPDGKGAEWEAVWTKVEGFACEDAVRIPGVPDGDERRISPTKGLLRAIGDGKYALAKNVRTTQGYSTTKIGGRNVPIHRLVVKTFARAEFDAELAKMPPGTDESKLDIDHLDGDKSNNALANLCAKDRSAHASKHSAEIDWVDGDWVLGTYDTAAEAARAVRGTDGKTLRGSSILKVCKGDYAHTRGRKFVYVDDSHAKELATTRDEKKRKIDAVYAA